MISAYGTDQQATVDVEMALGGNGEAVEKIVHCFAF